ncbi:MAG TPA: Clp protease N-terminal domain-containing protein, partial [Mycobacteriales bacterium]|nr:Clp protease N-terminal domain-containing protein [Mycobacteriales bacterium]
MFERFTDRARHTIVLAQDEARAMQHNYIGTEHILLGLLGEPDGIGARALDRFGITLPVARDDVLTIIGRGKRTVEGHIPFTPRAKKILELALREALALHHNYIGTEHILLGLVREGDGVGAQVVRKHCEDMLALRMAVLDLVPAGSPSAARGWLRWRRGRATEAGIEREELHTSEAAEAILDRASRLAAGQPIGSHHLLLAGLEDPNSAVVRVLSALDIDLDRLTEGLRGVDVTGTSDEPPEEAGRRQMKLVVADDRLTIEVTDPTLIDLAKQALAALGESIEADTIPGDLPASTSLAGVWEATQASLHDIRRRSPSGAEPAADTE